MNVYKNFAIKPPGKRPEEKKVGTGWMDGVGGRITGWVDACKEVNGTCLNLLLI